MKVLEKGNPQRGWAKKYSCTGAGNGNGGCKAKLEVDEGDLYLTASHARDETTTYVTFMCPECGVETDIWDSDTYKGDVPSEVRGRLKSKSLTEREADRNRLFHPAD